MSISLLRRLLMKEAMKESAPFQHEGIMSISKSLAAKVEQQVQRYVNDAMRQGVDLDTLSPEQLKMIVQINKPKPPRVISADSLEGKAITDKLFGKRGEVVDMAGKKIDTSQGIMGGKSVEELMKSGQVQKGIEGLKPSKKVQDREMFEGANKRLRGPVKEKQDMGPFGKLDVERDYSASLDRPEFFDPKALNMYKETVKTGPEFFKAQKEQILNLINRKKSNMVPPTHSNYKLLKKSLQDQEDALEAIKVTEDLGGNENMFDFLRTKNIADYKSKPLKRSNYVRNETEQEIADRLNKKNLDSLQNLKNKLDNPDDIPDFADGGVAGLLGERTGYQDGNGVADEDAEKAALGKRVRELMDEGYDFGEAVKEAMKEGYADGGRTGFRRGGYLASGAKELGKKYKGSTLSAILENPKLLGAELGHDGIMALMKLLPSLFADGGRTGFAFGGTGGKTSSKSSSQGPAGGASAGGKYGGNRNKKQTYGGSIFRGGSGKTTTTTTSPPKTGGASPFPYTRPTTIDTNKLKNIVRKNTIRKNRYETFDDEDTTGLAGLNTKLFFGIPTDSNNLYPKDNLYAKTYSTQDIEKLLGIKDQKTAEQFVTDPYTGSPKFITREKRTEPRTQAEAMDLFRENLIEQETKFPSKTFDVQREGSFLGISPTDRSLIPSDFLDKSGEAAAQMPFSTIAKEIEKKYPMAEGGIARQNFSMGKRAFLKLIGSGIAGIAGLKSGILGLSKGGAKKAVTETVKQSATSGTPPPYFFKLVEKIKALGDDAPKLAVKDREVVTKYKDYTLTEDITTGEKTIQRMKIDDDLKYDASEYYGKPVGEEVYMNYKPGKSQADETVKGKTPPDEYTEDTSLIRGDKPAEGEVMDTFDGVPDDVLKEVEAGSGNVPESFYTGPNAIKKADGGRIGFKFGSGKGILAVKGILQFLKNLKIKQSGDNVKDFISKRQFMKDIFGNTEKNRKARQLAESKENLANYMKQYRGYKFPSDKQIRIDLEKKIQPILNKDRKLNATGGLANMLGE